MTSGRLTVSLWATVAVTAMGSAAWCQQPPIALSVEVVKRDVVLWEPIFAKLHVRNTSDEPVRMVPTYEAVRVRSVRDEGPLSEDRRFGGMPTWWQERRRVISSSPPARPAWLIGQGEEFVTWMGLLIEREMREPGTYHVTIDYLPSADMVREPGGIDAEPKLWLGTAESDAGVVVVKEAVGGDKTVAHNVLPWCLWLGWSYPYVHGDAEHMGDLRSTTYEPYARWYILWSKCLWHVPIPPNPLKGGPGPEAGYPAAAVRQFVAEYPDFPLNELADVAIAYGALHQAYADSVREADRLVDEKKLPWHGSSQYWRKVWSLWKPRLPEAWATVDAAVAKCQDRAVKDESAYVRWNFELRLAYQDKEQEVGTE